MSIDKNTTNPSPPSGRQQRQQPPNHDQDGHDSDDSLGSCPEDEHVPATAAPNAHAIGLDGQQPKRKGGRKPVSAAAGGILLSLL